MTKSEVPKTLTIKEVMETLDENRGRVMEAVYAVYSQAERPGTSRTSWAVDRAHLELIRQYIDRQYDAGRYLPKEP